MTDVFPPPGGAGRDAPAHLVDARRVKLHPDRLRVSGDGAFYTLQGEGDTMGFPAVFLRLHVCNLRCTWCDAWYTWNPRAPEFWTESAEWTPAEAAETAAARRLVVTGGEPLLQAEAVDALLALLPDWRVEIETNGTLPPSPAQAARCRFNVSPKLAHSGNSAAARIRPEALRALNAADSRFKFVVMDEADVEEIRRDFLPHLDRDRVALMPQGVTADEVAANGRRVAEAAKRHGFRLLGRLHVDLWGARRRV